MQVYKILNKWEWIHANIELLRSWINVKEETSL